MSPTRDRRRDEPRVLTEVDIYEINVISAADVLNPLCVIEVVDDGEAL